MDVEVKKMGLEAFEVTMRWSSRFGKSAGDPAQESGSGSRPESVDVSGQDSGRVRPANQPDLTIYDLDRGMHEWGTCQTDRHQPPSESRSPVLAAHWLAA